MSKIIEKKASIIWPNKGINYNVCTLIERYDTNGFCYEFIPNYFVLSLINSSEFDGIQGIDLSKKQDSYFRDFIPVFVYERIPQESRQDIREYLSKLDLDFYDPLEIMLRDKSKYCILYF